MLVPRYNILRLFVAATAVASTAAAAAEAGWCDVFVNKDSIQSNRQKISAKATRGTHTYKHWRRKLSDWYGLCTRNLR